MEAVQASEASSFGKYTLVAKLATGGMAEIFLARLLNAGGFEKLVCIKRILPHLARDPQFVAMFLDEARVVARISHPNVCQVFELGEIDGQYYIAMEYLAGVPLSVFRRHDYYAFPPDPRLVAGFGVQACEGLHHAHQLKSATGELLGVVHRDISPQNLFVTLDGIVKVLDFGIAKVQDQSIKTSTGAVKGTYCYMAPEQLRGEKVDRRADVWAIGTVLWETLAQRHLFKRETEFLTFQAITTDPIPDICEVRPDVPPLVGDTIARALSRDRDQRFPTARGLGEALAQAVGPLGGPLAAAAISDEVENSFETILRQQRLLLEAARAGDTFDLERSNPLGGPGTKMHTTPVSNIKGKLAAAQAEVEQYVRAQQAIRSLEDDEPSSSGFTPPPGWQRGPAVVSPARRTSKPMDAVAPPRRTSKPMDAVAPPRRTSKPMDAQPEPMSGEYAVAPAEWVRRDSTPIPIPLPPMTSSMAVVQAPHSKLPWIIALVAVGIAGAAAAMLYMSRTQPQPQPPAPTQPDNGSAVVMHTTPTADAAAPVAPPPAPADAAPAVVQATPADAAVEQKTVAAGSGDTGHKKIVTPAKPIVKEITAPPPPAGPPGSITIDSSPVYAVIFIDGKKYGETPLVNISLPPGKHAVRAVSPSGTTRNLSITIEPGKKAPVRRIEW